MKVAATYTFVVDVPVDQPLSPDGRPPKRLENWDPDALQAVDGAVMEYFGSVKDPLGGAQNIEIIEHPTWKANA